MLCLQINQLVDNQERLQKENTEGLKQVQYLYSQVMAKTEEVQKSQVSSTSPIGCICSYISGNNHIVGIARCRGSKETNA